MKKFLIEKASKREKKWNYECEIRGQRKMA